MTKKSNNDFESIIRKLRVFEFSGKMVLTYEEDHLRNIEFYVSRRGSIVYHYFQTVGKLVSLALRRKIGKKKIIEKLMEVSASEPQGFCDMSANRDDPLNGCAEYIARILDKYYAKPQIQNNHTE